MFDGSQDISEQQNIWLKVKKFPQQNVLILPRHK